MRIALWILFFFCFAVPFVLNPDIATSNEAIKRVSAASNPDVVDRDGANQTVFEQMESEATDFVKAHHPELVSLLQVLKEMREKEYETAIRDIDRVRKRIEPLQKREPAAYQIELDTWKIQSKIDLLLAKGFAQDKAFSTKVLKNLLKEQVDVQKRRLKNEQMNLAKRQESIADQLQKLEGHESERVEQQLAAHMKRVDAKIGKSVKPKQNPKQEPKPAKEAKVKS